MNVSYFRIPVAGFIVAVVLVLISAAAATGVAAKYDFGLGLNPVRDPQHP